LWAFHTIQPSSLSLMCVISKSPMTAKLLNVTNARSKSTVNAVRHDDQLATPFYGVTS